MWKMWGKENYKTKVCDRGKSYSSFGENTCSHPIIYSGNEIKTSKKDEPEMHGIGIKNIIQIVEKYNGEYVIKMRIMNLVFL